MNKKIKDIIGTSLIAILIIGIGYFYVTTNLSNDNGNSEIAKRNYENNTQKDLNKNKQSTNNIDDKNNKKENTSLLHPHYTVLDNKTVVDWNKPTCKKYIDLNNVTANNLKIVVDQSKQTLNIYDKNKLVEQFLISSGKEHNDNGEDTSTPVGSFEIQPQHGTWFFNNKPGITEGARNWISFKDNGVYLFHSVVMDKDNNPIMSRQGKLGHENSHGCIQMSLPDNQWFYDTFSQPNKIGTPVIIQ